MGIDAPGWLSEFQTVLAGMPHNYHDQMLSADDKG